MATIFWDSHGIIFIDYLKEEKTINGKYQFVAMFERRNKGKTTTFDKETTVFLLRQCTSSHINKYNVKNP